MSAPSYLTVTTASSAVFLNYRCTSHSILRQEVTLYNSVCVAADRKGLGPIRLIFALPGKTPQVTLEFHELFEATAIPSRK